ncbi:hypothetical protein K1719_021217 [Acacia pycnantha]|nr:hypothetical protein K1719_021217 [Acacia pycnantha]
MEESFAEKVQTPTYYVYHMIPFFQQLITGINVIMFYAPVLFNSIGFKSNASLTSAVITGFINVLATIVSILGVDRWGRRTRSLSRGIGGIQMLICQIIVAISIGMKFGMNGNPGVLPIWRYGKQ